MLPPILHLGVAAFLFLGLPLRAESYPFQFEHFSREDGLPDGSVFAILQDHLGFLWLGTGSGLVRYDGYTMKVFLPEEDDPHSIAGRKVGALHEDSNGNLWVLTTDGGLNFYDRGSARFTRLTDESIRVNALTTHEHLSITPDGRGNLWVATGTDGLRRVETATGQVTAYRDKLNAENRLSSNEIRTVFVSRAGVTWVGTTQGINRFDEDSGRFVPFRHDSDDPTSLSDDRVWSVAEDLEGQIWIGTERGLDRFDAATGGFVHFRHDPADSLSIGSDSVYVIHADVEGRLWLATGRGIDRFDAGSSTFAHFLPVPEAPQGSGRNVVRVLLQDDGGRFWLATPTPVAQQDRVLVVLNNPTSLYSFDPLTESFVAHSPDGSDPSAFDPGAGIRAIEQDRSGSLWIGTFMGGLNKTDPSTSTFAHHRFSAAAADRSESGSVRSVLEDRNGRVWVGTGTVTAVPGEGALYRLSPEMAQERLYLHDARNPRSLSRDYVGRIFEDRAGWIWVASAEGIEKLDPETNSFTKYVPYPGAANPLANGVVHIDEDLHGKLWLATMGGGLLRFDPVTESFDSYRYDAPDRLGTGVERLLCLRFDRAGVLWIGTSGEGLLRFDPDSGRFAGYHDPARGLVSVNHIHEDVGGRLWLATSGNGLLLFDRSSGSVTAFTTRDGLAHDLVQSILEDDAGNLWLSTGSGLSRFNPESGAFRNFGRHDGLGGNRFLAKSAFKGKTGRLYFGGPHGVSVVFVDRKRDNPHPPQIVFTGLRVFNRPIEPDDVGPLRQDVSVADGIRLSYRERDVTFEFAAIHFSRPEQNTYSYRLEGYEQAWRAVGGTRTATYTNLAPGKYTFRVRAANADGVWNETGASVRMIVVPPWWQRGWFYATALLALIALSYAGYTARVRHLRSRARALKEEVVARTRELVVEKQTTEAQARRLAELDQTKSRFFANISHEFRTPLTLILGPIQDALAADDVAALSREQLHLMQGSASRLLRLVNQLLDLSKIEAGKMRLERREADLYAFLAGLVAIFQPHADRRQVTLRFRWNGQTQPIAFDDEALEKVFSNLLSNALKFTPAGGKVWVTGQMRGEVNEKVVEVVVKDTGPGIPGAAAERIFDPFEQVGRSREGGIDGTGLGLALARELVELHQGTIRMES